MSNDDDPISVPDLTTGNAPIAVGSEAEPVVVNDAINPQQQPIGKDVVGNFLETITSRVTVLGGIVAAIVTLNSGLSSCSKDNIERYSTFRTAVDSEEKFWAGLYDQYLATFEPLPEGANPEAEKTKRAEKVKAIQALTSHAVPDFKEHQLGLFWNATAAQHQASTNIAAIKKGLVDALSRSGDPQVAQSTQAAIFQADEAQIVRTPTAAQAAQSSAEPVAVAQQSVQTGAVISYQSQTLALGDPKGWDIDVFWCAGPNEATLYGKAGAVAQQLANAANGTGSKLPAGDLLVGRIRLRSVPAKLQGNGYPATGLWIRIDGGDGEKVAGTALINFLNTSQSTPFKLSLIERKTNWYLSVFVCS